MKVTVREWYRRVEEAWPEGGLPALQPKEAERAARRLYRFAMKEKWNGPVEISSGNRLTWVVGGVLRINAEKGWADMVHLLSHYFHSRLNRDFKPHCGKHARLELRLIKEVLRRGWLTGKLRVQSKPKVVKAPPTVDSKLERARLNLARALTRAKRAQTILKKWERRIRIYERRLSKAAA